MLPFVRRPNRPPPPLPAGALVLVCGGREMRGPAAVTAVAACLALLPRPAMILQGGATGADALARVWAFRAGVPVRTMQAAWARHGRAAGPIRNGLMLAQRPALVVAFPGGAGTADMISQACRAGVPVWRPLCTLDPAEEVAP